jgi:hypothetical protein
MATKTKRRRKLSKAKRLHSRDKAEASRSVFERADAGDYVLTFGLHKGWKISEVGYNYLQWLKGVETQDLSVKAAQRVARGLGHRKKVGTRQQAKRVTAKIRQPKRKAEPKPKPGGSHRLRFGKHSGWRLDAVPEDYLIWMRGIDSSSLTVQQDQKAVEKYLTPAVSKRGKRRWCAICEAEQRGTVCVRCGWDLVSVERTGPVATMLHPDDW